MLNPAQKSLTASTSWADHLWTTEPRHRMRKRRVPLNVDVLSEIGGSAQNTKMLRSDLSGTDRRSLWRTTVLILGVKKSLHSCSLGDAGPYVGCRTSYA